MSPEPIALERGIGGPVAMEVRWMVVPLALLIAGSGSAEEMRTQRELAQEDRIRELERTVQVLADELERMRTEMAVPEVPELESVHGMGPAASKIYALGRGISLGGYGEGLYQNLVGDKGGGKNRADLLRMVLYAGYKFSDSILFNSEVEFEHATTRSTESARGGSVSVEFAALDFLWKDWANSRAGLLLVPMGFLNEIHEPPFFYGVIRPDVERRIIPTTWRENGAGLFGELFGDQLEYKSYVINGFNAAGFSPSGLRGGRQKGNRALAEHLAWVSRVDWFPLPGLQLGGSLYLGDSGQNQKIDGTKLPDTFTKLWELHAQVRFRGLSLRGLFTMAHLDDAGALSGALTDLDQLAPEEAIASEMLGGYGEIAYDVLHWLAPGTEKSLEPFFRFEFLDTQHEVPSGFTADDSQQITNYTVGFSFKPIANVVVKADYRDRDAESGSLADEFNLGVGLAF